MKMAFLNAENIAQTLVDVNNSVQIESIYRFLTFLISCSSDSKESIHISNQEKSLLNGCLINVKQCMIKCLYKNRIKFDNFMDIRGQNL